MTEVKRHEIVLKNILPTVPPETYGGGTEPNLPDDFIRPKREISPYVGDFAESTIRRLPTKTGDSYDEPSDFEQERLFSFLYNLWKPEFSSLYQDAGRKLFREPTGQLQKTFQHKMVPVPEGEALDMAFATRGSSRERLNEDSLLIFDFGPKRKLAVVFDGASSQKPVEQLQKFDWIGAPVTPAFYVSHVAAVEFPFTPEFKALANNPDTNARDFIIELNKWLKPRLSQVEGVNYDDVLTVPGMCATAAVIDEAKRIISIGHVADTIAIVESHNADGAVKYDIVTDNRNEPYDDETMALVKEISKARGISIKDAAKDPAIKEQLAASFRRKINTKTGTGIVNGMSELVDNGLIQLLELPLDSVDYLFLASDGQYTPWVNFLKSDISQTERNEIIGNMLDRIQHSDPRSWLGRVGDDAAGVAHAILDSDPTQDIIPRLKAKDDATFIAIEFRNKEIAEKVA